MNKLSKSKQLYNITKLDLVDDGTKETNIIDIMNKKLLLELIHNDKEFDCIFALAGPCSVIQFNKDPVKSMYTTIHGFRNILSLATRHTKVIYPSSGNVYGDVDLFREDICPKPNNLYAASKLACEDLASVSNKDTLCFRIFAGYGDYEEQKGELSSVIGTFVNDILNDRSPIVWGDGLQNRDFVYIDDITDIFEQVIWLTAHARRINIGTGISTSFIDVVKIINKILGKNIKPTFVGKPKSYVEKTCADTKLMNNTFKTNNTSLYDGINRYLKYLGYKQ